jgi:hypothetical protein
MPDFILRRHVIVAAYPDEFKVLIRMDDGYELDVGHIDKQTGAHMSEFWAWACHPGANGRAPTLEDAMAALRAAWSATDEQLADLRMEQEWTANKYALWAAGYKNQLGQGPVRCLCGEMFDPAVHAETMAHIGHITNRVRQRDT